MQNNTRGVGGHGVVRSDIGPFTIIPKWLLDMDLSARAVHLYAIIGTFADRDGGGAFPSRRTLSKRMGVNSLRTVDAVIAELTRVGALIKIPRRRGDDSKTSNEYILMRADPRLHPHEQSVAHGVEQPVAHLTYNQDLPRVETTEVVSTPSRDLIKVGGRNLPFDALVEACSIDTRNKAQVGQLTKALKDIRWYFDEEIRGMTAQFPTVTDVGAEEFEQALAKAIHARAQAYRRRFRNAELTPTALAKWWHQLVIGAAQDAHAAQATRDFLSEVFQHGA